MNWNNAKEIRDRLQTVRRLLEEQSSNLGRALTLIVSAKEHRIAADAELKTAERMLNVIINQGTDEFLEEVMTEAKKRHVDVDGNAYSMRDENKKILEAIAKKQAEEDAMFEKAQQGCVACDSGGQMCEEPVVVNGRLFSCPFCEKPLEQVFIQAMYDNPRMAFDCPYCQETLTTDRLTPARKPYEPRKGREPGEIP